MILGHEIDRDEKSFVVDFDKLKAFVPDNSEAGPLNAKHVAEYAAGILSELRDLAGNAELTFLAYLIQVAVEEARIQADERADQ